MIQINSSAGLLYDPRLTDPVRRLFLAGAKADLALNKTGAITLIMPEGHPCYGELTELVSEVWVTQDGDEFFRGRVRDINTDIDGMLEVVVEGLKGYLRDDILGDYTVEDYGGTVRGWLQMCIDTYNDQREGLDFVPFALGTVDEQALDIEGKDYKEILSAIDGDLLKAVGGYLSVVRSGGYNVISWTLEPGPIDDQVIEYGVNMTGYRRESSAANLYTAVLPLGKNDSENGKLTIESVNDGSDILIDSAALARYGLITKKVDHSEIEDANELLAAGQQDLAEAGLLAVSVEASAVDLADAGVDVGRLRLGHKYLVRARRNDPGQILPISRISADLLNPGAGMYTFSQEFQTLTQQKNTAESAAYRAAAEATSAAEKAAHAATPDSVAQAISTSEAKYVDYVSAANGAPGWHWRQWQNGQINATGVIDVTVGTPSAYGTGLQIASAVIALPFSTSDTDSMLNAGVSDNSDGYVVSIRQTAVNELTVRIAAPTIAASYRLGINLWGTAAP